MLFVKSFHLIAIVAWFAGLFYLPRLFVYHATTSDSISLVRFKQMEKRLYYGITWPAALLSTGLGLWLLSYHLEYYLKTPWMHAKLALVLILWVYHLCCGFYLRRFALDKNQHSERFFRIFNEVPTVLLIGIVLLVVMKPVVG